MKFVIILLTIAITVSFIGFSGCAPGRFLLHPAHIFDSATSIVKGLGSQVLRKSLSPKNLLKESKQWLFGLPEVAILNTMHQLCTLYLSSAHIDPKITPDIDEMYFQLRTPCSNYSFPIERAEHIWSFDQFKINQPVVLFISGWTSTIESDNILHMAKAYNLIIYMEMMYRCYKCNYSYVCTYLHKETNSTIPKICGKNHKIEVFSP